MPEYGQRSERLKRKSAPSFWSSDTASSDTISAVFDRAFITMKLFEIGVERQA